MSTPTATSAPEGGEPNKPKKEWTLLKAIEFVLAKPEDIKKETDAILRKYRKRYHTERDEEDIKEMVANKVIKNYSYMAAFTGGTTALAGVVPGIGTVAAVAGGATADIALCMKFQVPRSHLRSRYPFRRGEATLSHNRWAWSNQPSHAEGSKGGWIKSFYQGGSAISKGLHLGCSQRNI